MARVLTRAQALQNRAFLKVLRRTGNVRLACREVGLKYGTMQHRRAKHPAFAQRWDAALVFAQAKLMKVEKNRHASESRDVDRARFATRRPDLAVSSTEAHLCSAKPPFCSAARYRTRGGEPVVVRLKNGKVQVRRAQPGKLTREAEQAFLAALSATCNMRLSAAAVGAAPHAFYRRRTKDSAFAREQRLALTRGYEALELALIESGVAGSHEHDDWRHNEPPAIPPMSANQALQLMYLHQKAALLVDLPMPLRRRPGESREACCERLAQMAEARAERHREEFEVAEAERRERGLPAWGPAGEAVRRAQDERSHFGLPDLSQVTGWSNADPEKTPHDPDRALFGGWRIEDMERELELREWDWVEPEEPERVGPRVRRL